MPYVIDGKAVEPYNDYWAYLCDKHGWGIAGYESGPGEYWNELDSDEKFGFEYRFELEANLCW